MGHWNLHKVEEAFAAAALDPARWTEALGCISAETDSTGALLLPVSGGHIPTVPVTERLARANETYFRDGWHLRDQRYHGVPKMCQTGVIDDLDCVPGDEIRRHPFYQEFLAPLGLRWFAGVNMQSGHDIWCVSINRSIACGPFSAGESASLRGCRASFQALPRWRMRSALRRRTRPRKHSTSAAPRSCCSTARLG